MPCYVTTVKIVYVTDGVTVKVSLLCLAIKMCQIVINSYMINHCLFLLKLFSQMCFAQIQIILLSPLFERDPLPIRCRQTRESEMSF